MDARFVYRWNRTHMFVAEVAGHRFNIDLVKEWCRDQFGPRHVRWEVGRMGRMGEAVFVIFGDEDAFAFKLRWC